MTIDLTPRDLATLAKLAEIEAKKLERYRQNRAARGQAYTPPPGKYDATLWKIEYLRSLQKNLIGAIPEEERRRDEEARQLRRREGQSTPADL